MSYHGMDFLTKKARKEIKEFSPHPWTGEFIGKLIADHVKNGRADEAVGLWRESSSGRKLLTLLKDLLSLIMFLGSKLKLIGKNSVT